MAGKAQAEARRWYQQATFDLMAAAWNIQGGFHDTACFLAHQAGEKALKSLLYYQGARREALLSHSLMEMVQEATKALETVSTLREPARDLDLHYIPSRYPNGLPAGYPHRFYDRQTADRALKAAEGVVGAVRDYFQARSETGILSSDEP